MKLQALRSADKAFAASLLSSTKREKSEATREYPHMEWKDGEFVPQIPAPSPVIAVEATVMEAAHKKL